MQDEKADREERQRRRREMDAFWDVDDLIPPRRAYVHPADTGTVEVSFDPPAKGAKPSSAPHAPIPPEEPRRVIPPREMPPAPEEEYTPENTLLRHVSISRWRGDYHYYEAFLRDALRLFAVHGVECRRKPFFSYVPQYSQMDLEQLNWYLWWRERVRQSDCMDTDYSYIQLYISELINLSKRMEPLFVQSQLLLLWRHYRGTFHQLDSSLPEWICDHGLLHRLPPPDLPPTERSLLMYRCRLREYYVPAGKEGPTTEALLAFCNGYDWHKSKFCTEEHRELFRRVITGAVERLRTDYPPLAAYFRETQGEENRMLRDAYSGCICTAEVKRKIQVRYVSFSRDEHLRQLITDGIKYTENRIRVHLGVRSKLTVYALPEGARQLLEDYFAQILPRKMRTTEVRESAVPAYEKLYDLPQKPLSFASAAEIESSSWDITKRLVEAFEEREEESAPPKAEASSIIPQAPPKRDPKEAAPSCPVPDTCHANPFSPYRAFLLGAIKGDAATQRAAAAEAGKLPDLLADEINDLAAEQLGDILLEDAGGYYTVIEDYRAEAEEILRTDSI